MQDKPSKMQIDEWTAIPIIAWEINAKIECLNFNESICKEAYDKY